MAERWLDEQGDVSTQTETEEKIDLPKMWKVLLHNDNYTTMDFVVLVLVSVFHKSQTDAIRIMLDVHQKGIGVVGMYPREIAESHVQRVESLAKQAQFPLLCTMESE